MKYLVIIKPVVMSLARSILPTLGRTPLEREYGQALVASLSLADKVYANRALPEDYAEVVDEFEDVIERLVKSGYGEGGLKRYREARS
jgi:hypothetical protein|tara:strand:- start:631 stop:894 length:264 start_codon:yes stop_codon:yes gene_type:complete